MRTLLLSALLTVALALGLASPANAQTTGVPGVNDYTIAGFGSGSTSCTFFAPPIGGGWPMSVSATGPGLPVLFHYAIVGIVPGCVPGFFPLAPLPCVPFLLPHSIDIVLGAGSIPFGSFAAFTGAGGVATVVAPPFAPLGLTVTTQAYVIDPTCGGLVATQAYTLAL
ncbi:MAG: hypothetical protein AAF682_27475 [Planctomycetota bacterium]